MRVKNLLQLLRSPDPSNSLGDLLDQSVVDWLAENRPIFAAGVLAVGVAFSQRGAIYKSIDRYVEFRDSLVAFEQEKQQREISEEKARLRFRSNPIPLIAAADGQSWAILQEGLPVINNSGTGGTLPPGSIVVDIYGNTAILKVKPLALDYQIGEFFYPKGSLMAVTSDLAKTSNRDVIGEVFTPELLAENEVRYPAIGRITNVHSSPEGGE